MGYGRACKLTVAWSVGWRFKAGVYYRGIFHDPDSTLQCLQVASDDIEWTCVALDVCAASVFKDHESTG